MFIVALALIGGLCIFNVLAVFGKRSSALAAWPAALLFLFIAIVHVLVPYLKYEAIFYRWRPGYPDEVATTAMLIVGAALLVLTYGWRMAAQRIQWEPLPALPVPPGFVQFIALTYAAGAFFALRDLSVINQMGGIDAYMADRIAAGDERGFVRLFGFFMATAIVCYAYACCRRITAGNMTVLALMCALPIYYYSALSSRNSIFFLAILIVFMLLLSRNIHLSLNRYFVGAGLIIGTLAVSSCSVISTATAQRYEGLSARMDSFWLYSLDGAFGNNEALLWLTHNPHELALGQTYAAAATVAVPRALWPSKPTGGGPYLTNLIFPGKYQVGAEDNSSLTTGMFVEAAINFGSAGLFMVAIAWILAAQYLVRRAYRAGSLETQLVWTIAVFTLSTAFVYMEFLGFVARVGTLVLPLLLWAGFRRIVRPPLGPHRS